MGDAAETNGKPPGGYKPVSVDLGPILDILQKYGLTVKTIWVKVFYETQSGLSMEYADSEINHGKENIFMIHKVTSEDIRNLTLNPLIPEIKSVDIAVTGGKGYFSIEYHPGIPPYYHIDSEEIEEAQNQGVVNELQRLEQAMDELEIPRR